MSKLQLFINGTKITEWDIFMPSFTSLNFKDRCDAKQKFIKIKAKLIFHTHLRALLKYPDYEIIYITESRGNLNNLGKEHFEINTKESNGKKYL